MKRKRYTTNRLITLSRSIPNDITRKRSLLAAKAVIDKMNTNEKIELFQQFEIAQGVRKGLKTTKALSPESQKILLKYDAIPSKRRKTAYAESMKNQVFLSLKKCLNTGE